MNLREEMPGDREYCLVKIVLLMLTEPQTSFRLSVERNDISALCFLLLCGFDGELLVYSTRANLCARPF